LHHLHHLHHPFMRSVQSHGFLFEPSGKETHQVELLPYEQMGTDFPNGVVQFEQRYDEGFLLADDGTRIHAFKPQPASAHVRLLTPDKDAVVATFPSLRDGLKRLNINLNDVVPGSNCHGLVFSCASFWIGDDQVEFILAGDGYEMVPLMAAQIVIYRLAGAVVHSARVAPPWGDFISKAGVRGMNISRSLLEAARGIAHDSCTFYAKKAPAAASVPAQP
jgi:hypothetical protein